jgi:hypothetical protein
MKVGGVLLDITCFTLFGHKQSFPFFSDREEGEEGRHSQKRERLSRLFLPFSFPFCLYEERLRTIIVLVHRSCGLRIGIKLQKQTTAQTEEIKTASMDWRRVCSVTQIFSVFRNTMVDGRLKMNFFYQSA